KKETLGEVALNSIVVIEDHLRYVSSLNQVMQQLRDREVAWAVPAKNLDARQRERTEQRQKKKLLTETINSLLDSDPEDKLGIRKKVKGIDLYQWLKDYERKAEQKKKDVNTLAGEVTKWLEAKITTFVVETYRVLEKVDPNSPKTVDELAQFATEYQTCMDRCI